MEQVWKRHGTDPQRNANFEILHSSVAEGSGSGFGSSFQISGSRSRSGWPFPQEPDQLY